MIIKGHRIETKIEGKTFIDLISEYKDKEINCTSHTFFRLSEKQRTFFKCEELKEYILNEVPLVVGIQFNKNYTVYYKHKKKDILRLILEIKLDKIEIVTFYIIDEKQMPKQ